MNYYINGEEIFIPTEKREFGSGSEGKVYKIGDKIYKIYYKQSLNEGYGHKMSFHGYLKGIPTKQIILPSDLILDFSGDYVGYVTPFIEGNQKEKHGITNMPSEDFINNLKQLEKDFKLLSDYYVLASDVTMFNYLYDAENRIMNVIDPGRYRNRDTEKGLIERQNDKQLDTLISILLYQDFIKYKPIGSKRKSIILKDKINEDKGDLRYSEYFEDKLSKYDNVHEFSKSLGRYIK